MLPGVAYEYYASLSGLIPKYAYSRDQHETAVYYKSIKNFNDSDYNDDYPNYVDAAVEFYTQNSGLTPTSSYTVEEHVQAYFGGLVLNGTWKITLESEAIELATNLFTLLFESSF